MVERQMEEAKAATYSAALRRKIATPATQKATTSMATEHRA